MENLYTGGQLAVKLMEEFGVKVAFGIPGGQTLSVNNAVYDSTIRFVHTRHENGAAVAADGYGARCLPRYHRPRRYESYYRLGRRSARLQPRDRAGLPE